ncbi:signal peptide peptidase SppA [Pirellulales bacterium]|nr:signal peptide peptidase SppA [Pirellulales bacterium]
MGPLRPITLLLALLAGAGCKGPVHLVTDSCVKVALPPHKDTSRIVPMRVADGSCDGPRIALIDVDGLLLNANMTGIYSAGENPVAAFREKLDYVARRSCYSAVVLRINSPGGGVTATDIMRRDLMNFRATTGLPVIACLMDLGAGGAYYLATAADQIVAHPTTVTGGIGVILNLYNLEDTMAQANIEGIPVKAGEFTDLGSPITRIEDDAREILQHVADEFHERFRDTVRTSRSISLPDDADLFDGRIFTASQAAKLNLIDSIGYVDDALNQARQCCGFPGAAAEILHRPRDPAKTVYAITPNIPIQGRLFPLSVPGLDRSRLPAFLYLWQPEPTMETLGAK